MKARHWCMLAVLAVLGLMHLLDRLGDAEPGPPPDPSASAVSAPRSAAPPRAPAPAPPDAPPPPPAPAAAAKPSDVTVVGRVVGAGRRPAPGAEVTLRFPDRPPVATKADGAGRFVVEAGARPRTAGLRASALAAGPSGEAGIARFDFAPDAPDVIDAGTIGLVAGAPLEARVVDAGVPVPSARVFAWTSGPGWCAEARADDQGLARFAALPAGAFRLLALADARRAQAWITHPRSEPGPLVLALEPARTIEVTVVDAADRPVEGAALVCSEEVHRPVGISSMPYVPAVPIPRTDAQGRTVIAGLGAKQTLRFSVWRPGRPLPRLDDYPRIGEVPTLALPGTDAVRIVLPEPAELRWAAGSGGVQVPTNGTTLILESLPDGLRREVEVSGEARMEGGELVVRTATPPELFRALVVAPDGALAEAHGLQFGGRSVVFRPSRRLEVELRDEQGRRLEGLTVRAQRGGGLAGGRTARTDADGKARFERLGACEMRLTLVEGPGLRGLPRVLGSADLRNADQRIELEVPAERDVILRVSLQGRPGLPSAYKVSVVHRPVEAVTDDPERSELRFRARPPLPTRPIEVKVEAPGFADETVQAQAAETGGPLRADVDLQPTGTLVVRVLDTLEGKPSGPSGSSMSFRGRVLLEQRRDTDGAWMDANREVWTSPFGEEGAAPVTGLKPGRYRARDSSSGTVSTEADVASGAPPVEVTLDLRSASYAEGRIEAPEGTAMDDVRVVVEGVTQARSPEDGVRPDGTFRVRVPGDRVVRLRPTHPLLAAAGPDGCATVQAGRSGIVLRLAPGPTARFRPPPLAVGPVAQPRVLLFRRAVGPEPVSEHRVVLSNGVARFGGFAPGAWIAWFDLPGHAPVAANVELGGEGETDLGDVRPPAGSTLRVERADAEGGLRDVTVVALDPPAYLRRNQPDANSDVLVPGLGAGRFRARLLVALKGGGGLTTIDRTFEADGRAPVTIRAER